MATGDGLRLRFGEQRTAVKENCRACSGRAVGWCRSMRQAAPAAVVMLSKKEKLEFPSSFSLLEKALRTKRWKRHVDGRQ